MTVRILAEAELELNDAIVHYEKIDVVLSRRLKTEAGRVLQRIKRNPELPRIHPRGYPRINLRVFPYYIAYFLWSDTIWILTFAHGHREPEYWINRTGRFVP